LLGQSALTPMQKAELRAAFQHSAPPPPPTPPTNAPAREEVGTEEDEVEAGTGTLTVTALEGLFLHMELGEQPPTHAAAEGAPWSLTSWACDVCSKLLPLGSPKFYVTLPGSADGTPPSRVCGTCGQLDLSIAVFWDAPDDYCGISCFGCDQCDPLGKLREPATGPICVSCQKPKPHDRDVLQGEFCKSCQDRIESI
jgi:hypothetical protein